MPQFALHGSECKLVASGQLNAPEWASGGHARPAWAFHSGSCGKLAHQLSPSPTGGAPCASASCSRSLPTTAPPAVPRRSPHSRRRRSGPRTSACRLRTARACSPPSNAGSWRPRLESGLGATAAAHRAAPGDAAMAATPSYSRLCMAMCSLPARGCTAVRARARKARPPSRHCGTCFLATSPLSGCTWKRGGLRSCPTPPQSQATPSRPASLPTPAPLSRC